MLFGERLKNLRKRKKVSQVHLSKITGISQSTITYYESGESHPGADNLIKIAKAMNVSADYLLGLTEEEEVSSSHPIDQTSLRPLHEDGTPYSDEELNNIVKFIRYVKNVKGIS